MQEPQAFIAEDCPTSFFDSYDIPGASIVRSHMLSSGFPYQGDSFHDFNSSPYSEEDAMNP
jgi:hypothetical protein